MSSSDPSIRRIARGRAVVVALVLAIALGGCSFRPMYGGNEGAALRQRLSGIEVAPLGGRNGQILRNFLIDAIGQPEPGAPEPYRLEVATDIAQNALLIQLDDVATRYDLSFAARFALKRKSDGVTVYRSAVRRVASYNVRDEPFATLVARRDAERRAAREVSREIEDRLALFLADGKP